MVVLKHHVNNLNVYQIETKKFKTTLLGVIFTTNLTRKYLAEKVILSTLLVKNCSDFPNEQDFLKYLRGMYDTNIFGDVSKRGKTLQIMFGANIINDNFLEEKVDLVSFTQQALKKVIMNPYLEQGKFSEELLIKEKKLLIDEIKAQNNNPKMIGVTGLIRNMFKGETYELYSGLEIEDVQKVTVNSLQEAYNDLLDSNCYGIMIGDISSNECQKSFQIYDDLKSFETSFEYIDYETKEIMNYQEIIEEKNINQSVLLMGYRTNIHLYDDKYYAMSVMNGMFGAFFHSTLIQEIREKLGLSYYIQSEFVPQKGFLAVTTGINAKDYEKIKTLICKTLKDYQEGRISNHNLEMTKETLINALLEGDDLLIGLLNDIYRFVEQKKRALSLSDKINLIQKVTLNEIIDVSKTLKLDTIFLVKGTKKDD